MSVTTNRADDSAAIARAIHDSYWTDWRNLSRRSQTETAGPINESLNRLRTELNRLDSARERLIVEAKIDEFREQKSMSEDIEIQALQPQIAQNAEQIRRLQAIIRQYETLASGAGGVVTIPDEIRDLVERDPVVIELKQRLSSLRSEIMANVQLGEDHPNVRQARRRVEATEAELASLRESQMRKLFDAELDRSRRSLEGSQSVQTDLMARLSQAVSRKQDVTRALAQYDKIQEDRRRVQDEIERNQAALTAIDLTQNIRGTEGDRVDRIRLLVPPSAPDEMHFPKLTVMLPLGVVLVFGLTAGLIVLRELLDQRIKGPSDLSSVPRVRLMGVIPSVEADPTRPAPETAYRDAPLGALADAYRQVRSPLVKRLQQSGYKSLLVAGGQPGSGATSVACNLALGCAMADQRVLLIDANLRRPALHRIFKVGEGPGLGEVLARKTTIEQAIQHTGTTNLDVLTAGAAANRVVPERLSTELMSQTIAEAASRYDIVIIDASPAAITGDAIALANRVDATLLVIRARSEKRGLVARLRDQFESSRGEFLGVVVQGVEVTRTGYLAKNIKASQEYAGNVS
jgi:capsular exopolysaccharide synthesis family protein